MWLTFPSTLWPWPCAFLPWVPVQVKAQIADPAIQPPAPGVLSDLCTHPFNIPFPVSRRMARSYERWLLGPSPASLCASVM